VSLAVIAPLALALHLIAHRDESTAHVPLLYVQVSKLFPTGHFPEGEIMVRPFSVLCVNLFI
jgi:hypothetical protein